MKVVFKKFVGNPILGYDGDACPEDRSQVEVTTSSQTVGLKVGENLIELDGALVLECTNLPISNAKFSAARANALGVEFNRHKLDLECLVEGSAATEASLVTQQEMAVLVARLALEHFMGSHANSGRSESFLSLTNDVMNKACRLGERTVVLYDVYQNVDDLV